MTKCSKCSCTERLTRHHIIPVCHFKGRRNKATVTLCDKCHEKIELIYVAVEEFIGDPKPGKRFRLDNEHYFRMMRRFLGQTRMIHAEFR